MIKPAAIKDDSPALAASLAFALQEERDTFFALSARRREIDDKVRFGLFALNGASIIAEASALGSGVTGLSALGVTHHESVLSIAGFAIGLVLAGLSIRVQQELDTSQAAKSYARMYAASRAKSAMEGSLHPTDLATFSEQLADFHKLPPVGFQFSRVAIFAQNSSAGAWLFGLAVPVAAILGWH